MGEPIRGQVAQLLTSRELVINRGTDHGVTIGMKFAVLNSKGINITDPETGESLGGVELEKTIVKVVRVQTRTAVARTFRTYQTGGSSLSAIFGPSKSVPETLLTNQHTAREELNEEDSYVKRGDPVVEFRGEEFLDQ